MTISDFSKDRGLSPVADLERGLRMIHAKLLALLSSAGVSSFECSGHPFDPDRQEAVATVDQSALLPGTVVDVVRRGYLRNDVLLRPAQVRVAK